MARCIVKPAASKSLTVNVVDVPTYLVTTEVSKPVARGDVSMFYNASAVNDGVTFWNGGQSMYFGDEPPNPAMPERVAEFLGSLAKDACPGWKQP
jgi:hypothetical protein